MRLSQTDVQQFIDNGSVEETLSIGPSPSGSLTYRLVRGHEQQSVSVSFENNRLTVWLPGAEADLWSGSDEVGIEAVQAGTDGTKVQILVEKDFACLTPRPGDDDVDSFPHPKSAKDC